MTDRELLELAAKAAGIKIIRITDTGMPLIIGKNEDGKYWDSWNPLTDDGDALRLAVKLELVIVNDFETGFSVVKPWNHTVYVSESHSNNSDPYAATRRAIVRAAAEIGKEMK